jgi:hypothetical protein
MPCSHPSCSSCSGHGGYSAGRRVGCFRAAIWYYRLRLEDRIFKKIALATISTSGALAAEYYVVQEKTTKKCKVVETRPSATETTWIQVGLAAFKTREEADK